MSDAWVGVVGAAIGGLVGIVGTLVARHLGNRHPSRRIGRCVLVAGALLLAFAGCDAASPGPSGASRSGNSASAAVATSAGAHLSATPDHFQLNAKTVRESSIFLIPTSVGVNINKWYPYAFGLDFHAFTIESIAPASDGTVTVILATNGGPIKKVDQNASVTNYGGQVQELYGYESDPLPNMPNTEYAMRILNPCGYNDSQGRAVGYASATSIAQQYLKIGESKIDFRALLNGDNASNLAGFTALAASVGKQPSDLAFVTNTVVLTDS